MGSVCGRETKMRTQLLLLICLLVAGCVDYAAGEVLPVLGDPVHSLDKRSPRRGGGRYGGRGRGPPGRGPPPPPPPGFNGPFNGALVTTVVAGAAGVAGGLAGAGLFGLLTGGK